jgi:serine carboxypeptidase-like clade 1
MDGFLYENGPLKFDDNYDRHNLSMHVNEFSWSNVANMVYLESPPGVGFSWSGNTNDYDTNDNKTAADNHAALDQFFLRYPQLAHNDLYLSGESYGGIYIPTLALRLANDVKYDNRFKGWAVGNALSDHRYDTFWRSYLPQVHGHGLITTDLFNDLQKYCNT